MKYMWNNIRCFLLLAVFGLSQIFGMTALAAEGQMIEIQDYEIEEGQISWYLHHNGEEEITTENLSMKLDNQVLPISDIHMLDLNSVPTTYDCLIDVSGSMDANRMASIRSVLHSLILQMKDMDNMRITSFADEAVSTVYTSDKVLLADTVDALQVTNQDTNLYTVIQNAIESLESSQEVHTNKCLIIFSDGAEEQASGITQEEAMTSVKEADIPVFTVAMLVAYPSETQLESAKVLGSFARNSSGGVHYTPTLDGYSYDELSGRIRDSISNNYIVTCKLEDIALDNHVAQLQATLTTQEKKDVFDNKELQSDLIRDYVVYTPQEVEVEIVPEESSEEVESEPVQEIEEEKLILGLSPMLFYGIVALVVVLIIVIIIVVVVTSKKRQVEPEESSYDGFDENRAAPPVMPSPAPAPQKQDSGKPALVIRLVRLNSSEEKDLSIPITGECSVGRSKEKSNFVIEGDKSLSSKHCTFLYRNQSLYIKDENSSNGTYVNGVPASGEFKLNQDDIILIGTYEYRVTW